MKQKTKQTIAIVLAAVILSVGGYAFGASRSINIGVNINSENAAAVNPVAVSQAPAAAPSSESQTTEAPQSSQPANSGDTQTEQPDAATPSDNASDSDMSVEQIVELYNSSANKVKSEASTLTRNYKKLESLPEYLELPAAIQGIGGAAIKQFVKGTDTPESWTSKEDMQTVFPIGGTDYTSHMTPDMVASASCTEAGSSYQLEIKLYDDKITSPEKGEGYAGVFNTVTASSISSVSIPTVTFNSIDVNGINGSISCTIDKKSKRVTDITFRNTDILAIDAKVAFSSVTAKLALAVEENYTIEY
ncbi:MAG: hypothetical protein ACI4GA_07410 [Acutalibacteraceae bacterium]|nr:hypothetical protein [Oscillospiraceae bacterium]